MKSKAGKLFGGFTTVSWNSSSGLTADSEAFIFSIDKLKVYPV